jgi:hypothetical protein
MLLQVFTIETNSSGGDNRHCRIGDINHINEERDTMKKQMLLFLCLFVAAILLLSGLSYAAQAGKINLLEGRVDVLKSGTNMASQVKAGDPVDIGDAFRAKSDGRLEITFINGNILKIAPDTRAEIQEAMFKEEKSSNVIKLHRGRVQVISSDTFDKSYSVFPEGNKFEVCTPNAVAGIMGSNMIVSFIKGVTTTMLVTGKGYLFNPNDPQRRRVDILSNQGSSVLSPSSPPTPVLPQQFLPPLEDRQPLPYAETARQQSTFEIN